MSYLIVALMTGDFSVFTEKYRTEHVFGHVRCQSDCV